MFPNVRLMIAAMAASVAALCCGFAMFATVRVNNEPLSRLPAGSTPLHLATDGAAPSTALMAGQAFGVRLPLTQTQSAGVVASPFAATGSETTASEPQQ